jgi:hypothetical protein
MKKIAICIDNELEDDQWVWEVDVKTKIKNILLVNEKIYALIQLGETPQGILDEFHSMDFKKGELI